MTSDVGIHSSLPTKEEWLKTHEHNSFINTCEFSEPKFKCPKCADGGMCKNLSIVLTSNPPKYLYECFICGHVEYLEY